MHVDNTTLLDYLTTKVGLEESVIGSADPIIPIDTNCTDDRLHFVMLVGSGNYEDEGDVADLRDAIPTASLQRRPATELERSILGTRAVMGMKERMAKMRMRMRRTKHYKPLMDQCRMWRTEGIVGMT